MNAFSRAKKIAATAGRSRGGSRARINHILTKLPARWRRQPKSPRQAHDGVEADNADRIGIAVQHFDDDGFKVRFDVLKNPTVPAAV
jgi:hypothetical protein